MGKGYPTNPKFIPHEFSMNDSTAFYEKQGFMMRLAGNSRFSLVLSTQSSIWAIAELALPEPVAKYLGFYIRDVVFPLY